MLIYYFLKVVSYQSLGLYTRLGVVATKSSIGPHPRCRPVLSCQFVHLSRRVRRPNDCSARKRNRLETVRVIFKAAVSRPNRPGPSSDLFVVVDTRSRSKRATSFANGKRRKRVISVELGLRRFLFVLLVLLRNHYGPSPVRPALQAFVPKTCRLGFFSAISFLCRSLRFPFARVGAIAHGGPFDEPAQCGARKTRAARVSRR